MIYLAVGCRVLLGAVFVASAASKLRTRGAFAAFVRSVDGFGLVPAARVRATAVAVVTAEAVIPVLLAVPVTGAGGFGLALVLLGVFTGAVTLALRRGVRAPCRCFGVSDTPAGARQVVRNLLLGTVAAAGLAGALSGTSGGGHPAGVVVAAAAGLLVAGLTAVADDLIDLFRPSTTAGAGHSGT